MPKELQAIRVFNRGTIGHANQEDVPKEAAVYTEDVDPLSEAGVLQGAHSDSSEIGASLNNDPLRLAETLTIGGTLYWVLVVSDGSDLVAHIWNADTNTHVNSFTLQSAPSYASPHAIESLNQAVYVGANGSVYWIGNVDGREQFGSSLSGWSAEELDHAWGEGITSSLAGSDQHTTEFLTKSKELYVNDAGTVYTEDVEQTTAVDAAEDLQDVKQVFVKVAAVYDGYVTGPLESETSFTTHSLTSVTKTKDLDDIRSGNWYFTRSAADDDNQTGPARVRGDNGVDSWTHVFADVSTIYGEIDITVDVDVSNFSNRITALEVYGATTSDAGASKPSGSYRLIETISTNDSGWSTDTPSAGTNRYTLTWDVTETLGASYDDRSGLLEEISDPRIDYRLSTSLSGRLYGGRNDAPSGASGEEWSSYIVRSEPYQFGVFNWSSEFIVLPFEPTALHAYNNRVYAFSSDRFAQINTNRLEIEDVFEGAGCVHHQSIDSNESGLFFCDGKTVYRYNGNNVSEVGEPIRTISYSGGNTTGIENRDTSSEPNVIAHRDDLVLVAVLEGGTTYYYVYDVPSNTWWIVSSPYGAHGAGFGSGGEAYVSGDTGAGSYDLHRVMDSNASRKSWTWVSQQLSMGTPNYRHKTYEVRASGASPTIKVSQGGEALSGTSAASSSATSKGYTVYSVSPSQSNTTQVRIEGSASDVLESIGIIFRVMRTP